MNFWGPPASAATATNGKVKASKELLLLESGWEWMHKWNWNLKELENYDDHEMFVPFDSGFSHISRREKTPFFTGLNKQKHKEIISTKWFRLN